MTSKKFRITAFFVLILVSFILAYSMDGTVDAPTGEISTFSSAEDFKSFVEKGETTGGYLGGTSGFQTSADMARETESGGTGGTGETSEPSRSSDTNVQVTGIDEPDIVKTNGENIFYSTTNYWSDRKTKIIDAYPPEDLNISSEIEENGKLFLLNETLIIISDSKINGYSISDPEEPNEKWNIDFNGSVVDARMKEGSVYLVTRDRVNYGSPCPVRPMNSNGEDVVVRCTDIYHPPRPVPSDITYHASKFDVKSGDIEETVSFVGSSRNSIVYMSENGIYITYTHEKDRSQIFIDFIKEEDSLFPSSVTERIEELDGYNISSRAKMMEIQTALEEYFNSLGRDEAMEVRNEFNNRFNEHKKENMRNFEKTGIVKISPETMEIEENGEIPGRPLNQFSMDEHKGDFRIATTVGERDNSENDVYVLNNELDVRGFVKGLGLTERVYSARFMGDTAYLVTYRQIDPFYVLDLSNPDSPEVKGELKITGYSSYLHPLDKDRVLGIGKENRKVKISMFDVSDPENPEEVDKYTLDEYFTDVLNTHRAFTIDDKHKVFFLPGGNGGYIFSYEDGIELQKTVDVGSAERAVYIDDYLYVIGQQKMKIIDENSWEVVNTMDFDFERDVKPMPEPVVRETRV